MKSGSGTRIARFPAILLVTLVLSLAAGSASAQRDDRLTIPEGTYRAALLTQMNAAAQREGIALIPDSIAYAGGEGGFVVNTAIEGADRLALSTLNDGLDLLFVYVGAKGAAVPEGYYRVRLDGRTAQFIDGGGKVVAALAARVEPGGPAAKKVHVKLTASWGKDGPEVDIEITFGSARTASVSIDIPSL